MIKLNKIARTLLKNCLRVNPHDFILIITEESLSEIGEALWKCAQKITPSAMFTRYSFKYINGYGLPDPVYNSLIQFDSIIVLTSKIVDEAQFEKARQNGTRIILLKNTSKELIERSMEANYKKLAIRSRKIADIFSIGKTLQLKSPSGTDVKINIYKTKGIAETGLVYEAGDFSCIPAGKACVMFKKKINGIITLDRIAGQKSRLIKPIVLRIQNGHITQIKGDKDAAKLRKDIRKFGKSGRQLSNLGVGTNDYVTFGKSKQEDEKVFGTAHISIGQNQVTKVHSKIIQEIKGIILKPTISIDDKLIIENGNILVY